MVLYVCFRCNYNTTHKNSFKNHLNRKFICNPILEDISIESIKLFYGFIKNENTNNDELQNHSKILQITPNHSNPFTPNNSIFTPNNSIFTPNNSKIDQSENHENRCEYCKKTYSRKDNLTKHLKRCKKKQIIEENNLYEKEKFLEMKQELEELKKNKNTNLTNITNNKVININLNNYGSENVDYINKKELTRLLTGAFHAIPKLVENIHFNPEHPENHNIKITNKKEPYIKVRKDNKWQLQDKKETLENLVDDKYYILEDHFGDLDDNTLKAHTKAMIEKFIDRFNSDEELQKTIQRKVEMVILNNS
tara:strand:- start:14889 stop:15812 length:924 start_codon:yes stop_codon:yes gene_type:complete